jgi:hypothetical protein
MDAENILNLFGFTNDPQHKELADAYRQAAIADGWQCAPMFSNEPVESAAELIRDGFTMQILTRETRGNANKWRYQVTVSIWGSDGLVIKPPDTYNWDSIKAGMRTCNVCDKTDVDTERYHFAGRCCADCRTEMARRYESPGWCK